MVLVFSGDNNKSDVALWNNNVVIFHLFIMQVSEGESLTIPRDDTKSNIVRILFAEFLNTTTENSPLIFGWIFIDVVKCKRLVPKRAVELFYETTGAFRVFVDGDLIGCDFHCYLPLISNEFINIVVVYTEGFARFVQ